MGRRPARVWCLVTTLIVAPSACSGPCPDWSEYRFTSKPAPIGSGGTVQWGGMSVPIVEGDGFPDSGCVASATAQSSGSGLNQDPPTTYLWPIPRTLQVWCAGAAETFHLSTQIAPYGPPNTAMGSYYANATVAIVPDRGCPSSVFYNVDEIVGDSAGPNPNFHRRVCVTWPSPACSTEGAGSVCYELRAQDVTAQLHSEPVCPG